MTPNQRRDMDQHLELEEKFSPLNRRITRWWDSAVPWMIGSVCIGIAFWYSFNYLEGLFR